MVVVKTIITMIALILIIGLGFVYSGIYPVGADKPHAPLTFWLLETLRQQSIAKASKDIEVPGLNDPQLLLDGGADYNDMCAGCHLMPGVNETDMSIGLYPTPPNLTLPIKKQIDKNEQDINARQQFWVIKHGITASGMAAFGSTHSDERIWAMVAFLRKLPELTPEQYQIITARQ